MEHDVIEIVVQRPLVTLEGVEQRLVPILEFFEVESGRVKNAARPTGGRWCPSRSSGRHRRRRRRSSRSESSNAHHLARDCRLHALAEMSQGSLEITTPVARAGRSVPFRRGSSSSTHRFSHREPAWRWLLAEGASHGLRRRHGIELVARGCALLRRGPLPSLVRALQVDARPLRRLLGVQLWRGTSRRRATPGAAFGNLAWGPVLPGTRLCPRFRPGGVCSGVARGLACGGLRGPGRAACGDLAVLGRRFLRSRTDLGSSAGEILRMLLLVPGLRDVLALALAARDLVMVRVDVALAHVGVDSVRRWFMAGMRETAFGSSEVSQSIPQHGPDAADISKQGRIFDKGNVRTRGSCQSHHLFRDGRSVAVITRPRRRATGASASMSSCTASEEALTISVSTCPRVSAAIVACAPRRRAGARDTDPADVPPVAHRSPRHVPGAPLSWPSGSRVRVS
jgi:hypothetical protein